MYVVITRPHEEEEQEEELEEAAEESEEEEGTTRASYTNINSFVCVRTSAAASAFCSVILALSDWCNVFSCPEGALQRLSALTAEQIERLRVEKIKQKKLQIATLASAIISAPYSNVSLTFDLCDLGSVCLKGHYTRTVCFWEQIKCLKELRGLLMETDPCVAVTVRKLVMVSLMEIFKDITPTYRIRPLTAEEKATKV